MSFSVYLCTSNDFTYLLNWMCVCVLVCWRVCVFVRLSIHNKLRLRERWGKLPETINVLFKTGGNCQIKVILHLVTFKLSTVMIYGSADTDKNNG